jgi:hypothetical protein
VDSGSIYLFPWRGTATLDALRLALKKSKLVADQSTVSLSFPLEKREELNAALTELAQSPHIDGMKVAELDENLERSKYDNLIPRPLLQQAAAIDRLNTDAIPGVAKDLCVELATI